MTSSFQNASTDHKLGRRSLSGGVQILIKPYIREYAGSDTSETSPC